MAGGIHKLSRSIKKLVEFLADTFTEEFLANVDKLLININSTFKNKNVADIIKQLKEALSKGGSISELINNINKILSSIDNKQLKSLFSQLEQLLSKANEQNLIGNVSKALESISSVKQFLDVAQSLVSPAKIFLYGTTGVAIGLALLQVAQLFTERKQDEYLRKLVVIATENLLISISQLRQQAGLELLIYNAAKQMGIDFGQDSNRLDTVASEARIILDNLHPLSADTLRKIQVQAEEMFREVYQGDLNSEKMKFVLNRVSMPIYFDETMNYIVYYRDKFGSSPEKPKFDRAQLSYDLVKSLYDDEGASKIDKIMHKLYEEFRKNGGDKLYDKIVNSWNDSAKAFLYIAIKVPLLAEQDQIDFHELDIPETWQQPLRDLITTYKNGVARIQVYWRESWSNNTRGTLSARQRPLVVLSDEAAQLVAIRGYLEFCKNTAKFFFAPRNIPREIINGGKDIGLSTMNIVLHPINTVVDTVTFPYDMLVDRNNKRTQLVEAAKAHPIRMVTGVALSTSAGVVIGNVLIPKLPIPPALNTFIHDITIFSKTVNVGKTLGSVMNAGSKTNAISIVPKAAMMPSMIGVTGPSTSVIVSGLSGVATGVTTGTVSALLNNISDEKSENINSKNAEINIYSIDINQDVPIDVQNFSLAPLLDKLSEKNDKCIYDILSEWWDNLTKQPEKLAINSMSNQEIVKESSAKIESNPIATPTPGSQKQVSLTSPVTPSSQENIRSDKVSVNQLIGFFTPVESPATKSHSFPATNKVDVESKFRPRGVEKSDKNQQPLNREKKTMNQGKIHTNVNNLSSFTKIKTPSESLSSAHKQASVKSLVAIFEPSEQRQTPMKKY
jgi:hypothetical protein